MKIFSMFLLVILATSGSDGCSSAIKSIFSRLLGAHETERPLRSIGKGFWNVRASFKLGGVEIGTHMSIIRLKNGNFLIIDAVVVNNKLKHELDELTHNGAKIEAVLAVHPFHTIAFPDFKKLYPNVEYYGTPRHLRKLPEIKWAGQLDNTVNEKLLKKWAPEVELRIPDGTEYFDPQPESTNHFASIFVFHRESQTLHVDDTLIYAEDPTLRAKQLLDVKKGSLIFFPSLKSDGLYPTAEAPLQFRDWMKRMLRDWDFENLCTAHIGVIVGDAHDAVKKLVDSNEKLFVELSDRNRRKIET